MRCSSHSSAALVPETKTYISQHYRQSLQPFVDPELLEQADRKPQLQPQSVTSLPANAHRYDREFLLALSMGLLCLFSMTYRAPSLTGFIPSLRNHIVTMEQKGGLL